jgi:hypothetical protein
VVVLALPVGAQAALALHEDPAVRSLVYRSGSQPLYRLLTRVYCTTAQLRGRLAGLCGSSSWGCQVLRGSALGGPAAALVFLRRLLAALRPAAVEDFEQLQRLATRRAALARMALNDPGADECSSSGGATTSSGDSNNGGGLGSSLHPADWSWALAQVQQVRGDVCWGRGPGQGGVRLLREGLLQGWGGFRVSTAAPDVPAGVLSAWPGWACRAIADGGMNVTSAELPCTQDQPAGF